MVQTAMRVQIMGELGERFDEILTADALEFLAELHQRFDERRRQLLGRREERQAQLDRDVKPDFLPQTESVRSGDWSIEPAPAALQDRRVEITGPVERKMVINALNSGARMFMADFEDSNSPTWQNCISGQVNLKDAVRGTISYDAPNGKQYRLGERVATLLVRPRGFHLVERHLTVDGQPIAGSFVDFGLFLYHNAQYQLDHGKGPYFYLPKLESHLEARLWNDIFLYAQERIEIPKGSIKATVLIETILAAFEMDEILYELREHSAGLNAGRWDYIFSVIKKFRSRDDLVLPDRAQITMTVPFMRAYTQLLVATCHRRGAHAMGGMAAFIPSRKDEAVNANALAKVREDKQREARDGFDGTWVAHPDLVPVAMAEFDAVLGSQPNQLDRPVDEVSIGADDLLDFTVPGGTITEAGLRNNVSVAVQYLEAWLRGSGAVAIFNLMEDAATAEISRSQIWQWVNAGARLEDGRIVTEQLVREILADETEALREQWGPELVAKSRLDQAAQLFEGVTLDEVYEDFLTLSAYDLL